MSAQIGFYKNDYATQINVIQSIQVFKNEMFYEKLKKYILKLFKNTLKSNNYLGTFSAHGKSCIVSKSMKKSKTVGAVTEMLKRTALNSLSHHVLNSER